MKIFEPEKFEIELVDELKNILDDKKYNQNTTVSEMKHIERRFLNGIIRQIKPKKILECGVSAGGSSAIILNAIKDIEDSFLYSIDYNTLYYRDNSKKTGFIINDKFPELANKWKLYTGGLAAKFIDEIGDNIDLCLLDTMHINPGEFIDFLIVLPYMKKNSVLVLHDIALHSCSNYATTNGTLFSTLKGRKMTIDNNVFGTNLGNIGLVILDDDIKERIFDYFYLLTLPWSYLPSNEDIVTMENFIKKHYGENYSKMFLDIALFYKDKSFINTNIDARINNIDNKINSTDNKINNIDNKINNIINTLAWWIPNKKKRDEFRKKINNF